MQKGTLQLNTNSSSFSAIQLKSLCCCTHIAHASTDRVAAYFELIPAIALFYQLSFFSHNVNLCSSVNEHGIAALEEKQTQLDELMTLEAVVKRWPQLFTAIELRARLTRPSAFGVCN